MEVRIQEELRTGGGSLLDKLEEEILQCSCVVHLIGESVGQSAKPQEVRAIFDRNPGMQQMLQEASSDLLLPLPQLSYTQWEAYIAIFNRIKCLTYIADSDSNRELNWVASDQDRVAQQKHLARLKSMGKDRALRTFADAREIAFEILQDVVGSLESQVRLLSGSVAVGIGAQEKKVAKNVTVGSGETFIDLVGSPQMVVVPSGSCMIGSADDEIGRWSDGREARKLITFSRPFAIGSAPITRTEYSEFVAESGYSAIGAYVCTDRGWHSEEDASWRKPHFGQSDNDPVVCINWDDARAYASWLTDKAGREYRLPTESEWEYASRAGTVGPYWFGTSISAGMANFSDGRGTASGTVDGRKFSPNPWGLYNVHGNVWEWCADTWRESHIAAPPNGHLPFSDGPTDRRVVRGGSWYDEPQFLRAASRDHYAAAFRASNVGFRLVREL